MTNTQSANQNDPQTNIELRIRTLRTLWIAMLMSIGVYFVFTLFKGRPENVEPNNTLFLVLVVIAMATTLISIPIKNRMLSQAAEHQHVQAVQPGYIVAWALCEIAAILGVIDFFATGDRYYYVLFIIGALGQLLHFPRREHVVNASARSPIF
jgi:magnesium-transporting ATPase (P-type)